MFEKVLRNFLIADAELISCISIYKNEPAIFANTAPSDSMFPRITFYIRKAASDTIVIDQFTVMIDFWDEGLNWSKSNKAAKRLDLILDRKTLNDETYSNIRIYRFGSGSVSETDPRAIHYNNQFQARATRKAYINSIVNNN